MWAYAGLEPLCLPSGAGLTELSHKYPIFPRALRTGWTMSTADAEGTPQLEEEEESSSASSQTSL